MPPRPSLPAELSTTALHLHLCAAIVSAPTERPGFVPDEFLASIAEDITLAVLEICLYGLWRREQGGYRIPACELGRIIDTLHEL